MPTKSKNPFRVKIDFAIEKVTALGWKIQPGLWVNFKERTCCPIGAALLYTCGVNNRDVAFDAPDLVTEVLGITKDEAYSFTDGYDGQVHKKEHDNSYYLIGNTYRRYFPPPKRVFGSEKR